jgi:hypothetical protein
MAQQATAEQIMLGLKGWGGGANRYSELVDSKGCVGAPTQGTRIHYSRDPLSKVPNFPCLPAPPAPRPHTPTVSRNPGPTPSGPSFLRRIRKQAETGHWQGASGRGNDRRPAGDSGRIWRRKKVKGENAQRPPRRVAPAHPPPLFETHAPCQTNSGIRTRGPGTSSRSWSAPRLT